MPLRFDGLKPFPAGRSICLPATRRRLFDYFGDVEIPIWAVRNDRLARLEMHLLAIEMNRHDVWFERHKIGNAADFGIGVGIGPCRLACLSDRIIAAETLVRAEGLEFHRGEGGLIDVGTWNVPAGGKTGFVEDQGPPCIGDDPALMVDDEMTGGLANVDPVVGIGCVAHDALIFLVKGIHGTPGEGDQTLQVARMGGQVCVLPRSSRRNVLLVRPDAVPGRGPKIRVLTGMLGALQDLRETSVSGK